MSSYSRIQLEEWLKTIDPVGKVLDIGGLQKPIKGRLKSWNVEGYEILDLPFPHGQDEAGLPFLTRNVDINLPQQFGKLKKFQTIFCIEVMEYVWNPVEALWNIYKLLDKGGTAYVTFHFLYGLHAPEGEDCLRYTLNGVQKLCQKFPDVTIIPRRLTPEGERTLATFYQQERMRLNFSDPNTYVEGCYAILEK
jgi:hypothetical protein